MKKLFVVCLAVASAFALGACNQSKPSTDEKITVTDMLKREVEIPKEVNKVICLGAGSLRLYSYVADISNLAGIEEVEKSDSKIKLPKRPYQVLHQREFDSLKICGMGGPKGQQPEFEKILECNPDVIFSTYKELESLNNITAKTGKPVVALNYGKEGPFGNEVKASLNLIGKIMNKEARAKEINSYMDYLINDLNNRTKDIKEEDKKDVYIGALGNFGMHGLEFSQAENNLLKAGNIKNILDGKIPHAPEAAIDKEILKTINPDLVIIDAGGYQKTLAELKNDEVYREIFNGWNAFKNDEVYVELPYKVYYMQVEIGFANAYFNAKLAYPLEFKDIDPTNKAKEIFNKFYGSDCYANYLEVAGLKDIVFNKLEK